MGNKKRLHYIEPLSKDDYMDEKDDLRKILDIEKRKDFKSIIVDSYE